MQDDILYLLELGFIEKSVNFYVNQGLCVFMKDVWHIEVLYHRDLGTLLINQGYLRDILIIKVNEFKKNILDELESSLNALNNWPTL